MVSTMGYVVLRYPTEGKHDVDDDRGRARRPAEAQPADAKSKTLMRQEPNVTKTGSPDEQENQPPEGRLDNNRPVEHELPTKREDFSPASQVGRSKTAGGSESVLDPEEDVHEGWPAPDQSDVPPEWPEPTVD